MGELNNIQYEISAEMLGDLSDIAFDFTASGIRGDTNSTWNPDLPDLPEINYSGKGIFGLRFNQQDSNIFQVEVNDQKAILMKVDAPTLPKTEDVIEFGDGRYRVIHVLNIPADNGWVLQLRKV